jgi:hypothetical protein
VRIAESLPLEPRQRAVLLEEAVGLGCAANPPAAVALFRRLPAHELPGRDSAGTTLVQTLAQTGDFETALYLLEDLGLQVHGAGAVIHFASDPAVQRRAMFAARERWRAFRKISGPMAAPFGRDEFLHLFARYWRKLEPAEQKTWLDEILTAIAEDPDRHAHSGYPNNVELHSLRDRNLFEILNVIRELKPPEEVEAILRAHPRCREGRQGIPARPREHLRRTAAVPQSGQQRRELHLRRWRRRERSADAWGYDCRLPRRPFRRTETVRGSVLSLRRRHGSWQPEPRSPRLLAIRAYALAMYWAGKRLGNAAEHLLAEIPEMDMALLGGIELNAAWLVLEQHSGVQMQHRLGPADARN